MQKKLLIFFGLLTIFSSMRAMERVELEVSLLFEQCCAAIDQHDLTLFKNSFSQINTTHNKEKIIERLKELALASKAKTFFYTPMLYREKKLEKWLCRGIIVSGYLLGLYKLSKQTSFFDFSKHPLGKLQHIWWISLLGRSISELRKDIQHYQNSELRIKQKQDNAQAILQLLNN